ncbi:MAG: hypothetical protein ACK58N_08525 [Synechocystis sp.]
MPNFLVPSLASVYAQLTSFAKLENFWSLFDTAFGSSYDFATAATLRSQWQKGIFSQFPPIEIISSDVLGKANGAYAISTNKIYLSDQFVNKASQQSLVAVILEEFGHFVDAKVNKTDTAGDEGEYFADVVLGKSLSTAEIVWLKTEDDHAVVMIDGREVVIEMAASDGVAPTLIGASLGSSSVDASSGEGRIRVQLQVGDNSSGFQGGFISFRSPSGSSSLSVSLSDPNNLISGTELSGTYGGGTLLSRFAEAGTWTFSSLNLQDDASNSRFYDSNALQLLGINPTTLSFTQYLRQTRGWFRQQEWDV